MTVKVSILTPSFNQARWLGDNLRSVACQSYENIEHIVMDGASTDGSVEVLKNAAPNVRWQSSPDRGQSHALNKALSESSGDVLGWLNSDDAYFDPYAVTAAVRVFERYPDVAVVYGHAALVNGDGLVLQMTWVPPYSYRLLRRYNFIIQPAAFIRRSALTDFIADESYDHSMDRELWLRLGQRHRFARLNRVLAIDRHQLSRKSLTRPDLARSDLERLVQAYGVPRGRAYVAQRKIRKVAFRLIGLTILREAMRPAAFEGGPDSLWRLALRQAFIPRAAMPVGQDRMQQAAVPL